MSLAQTPLSAASMPTLVNRVPDPSMQSGQANAQVSVTPAKYTMTYDTSVFHSGTQSALLTRTTSTLDTVIGALNATPGTGGNVVRMNVVPNEVVSVSAWCRCSVANWQSRISMLWKDSASANIGSAVNGPTVTNNPANTWVLVKYENITAPAGAYGVAIQTNALMPSGNCVGGELFWTDDLMMVSGSTVPAYGDGSMPGWIWSNGPNRSPSIYGLRSPAQLNRCQDPSMEASTNTGWGIEQGSVNTSLHVLSYDTTVKHSGARSLLSTRQASTPNNTVAAVYWAPSATLNSQPLSTFVAPGETISCGVWIRCSVDQWQSRLFILWRDAAGNANGTINSATITGNPANTWVWVTYENQVAPAGTVMAMFQATAFGPAAFNTVGGELTWFDDGMINVGPKVQTYWNPTTDQPPGGGAVWLGNTPGIGPACRPIGPWSQWDGQYEQPMYYAGVYDGATLTTPSLATVAVV